MRLDVFFILLIAGLHTLTFTPSITPGVTNYTIHYGPHPSRTVTNRVSIGGSTSWVITNAPASVAFLFATSWADGQESDPSNEVIFTNLHGTIQITMILERGPIGGPYQPTTNHFIHFVATEGNEGFRVRMEAKLE